MSIVETERKVTRWYRLRGKCFTYYRHKWKFNTDRIADHYNDGSIEISCMVCNKDCSFWGYDY